MIFKIICHSCNKTTTTKRKNQKYCNRKCYLKTHKEKISSRECKFCKNSFKVTSQNIKNKYCNNECRRIEAQIRLVKENNVISVTIDNKFYIKRCKICSDLFEVKKNKSKNTICSKECVAENYRTNKDRKKKISRAFTGEKHPNYIHGKCRDKIRDRLSLEDKEYIFKLFKNKCFKCGSKDRLEVDHHIAHKRGARLSINNAVILCKSCNSSKNAKRPEDFYTLKQLSRLDRLGIHEHSLFNTITKDDFIPQVRKNDKLKQSDYKMKIIKDSDYGKNLKGGTRYAMFECVECKEPQKYYVLNAKKYKYTMCRKCSSSEILRKNREVKAKTKCKNECDNMCLPNLNVCRKCNNENKKEYSKTYRDKNKEKIKENSIINKEKIKIAQREWYIKNKDAVKKRVNERYKAKNLQTL